MVCVLFRDPAGVEAVSFVAAEFPNVVEVSPQFLDQFLCPGCAGVFVRPFSCTVVLFLIFNDGNSDSTFQEVLPSNGLLMEGRSVEGVMAGKSFRNAWVGKPLDDALGD